MIIIIASLFIIIMLFGRFCDYTRRHLALEIVSQVFHWY